MGFILRIFITAAAACVAAFVLPGVQLNSAGSALIVALVLAFLNAFLKPLLVLLTIPVTIITLGVFLLVINIFIVMLTDHVVEGFSVSGWLTALLFSLIVTGVSTLLGSLAKERRD